MVRIDYDGKDMIVRFGGENFHELLTLCKRQHLKFDPDSKLWRAKPDKLKAILTEVGEIENDITITPTAEEILNKPTELETRFVRYAFDEALLKVPPIAPYQMEDVQKGIRQNRLMLALQMGLGKTWELINILDFLWHRKLIDRILIVAPSLAVYNWRRELTRFSPLFTEDQIAIANVENREPFDDPTKPIVIMTYRTFLMISDDYYKAKNPKKKAVKDYLKPPIPLGGWGTSRAIVLDECHSIKSMKSRSTKVLHLHKDFFAYRYLATGTPAPNRIEDYYSQISFLDEGVIGQDYYDWLPTIAKIGTRFSEYAVDEYIPEKVAEFTEKISPWVVRRYGKDHLNLPDLVLEKIYVELGRKQKDIYGGLISYVMMKAYEEKDDVDAEGKSTVVKRVMNKFPYLSLALDNPGILQTDESLRLAPDLFWAIQNWSFSDHSKLEAVESLLAQYIDERGQKVILWTGHPRTAQDLRAKFWKKYEPLVIHGQTKAPHGWEGNDDSYRDSILNDFKTGKVFPLLIASYKVISTAVNLQEAAINVYFDRDYSLTNWLQSQKRTHRIGQTEKVMVHPIMIEKTLDEHLDQILDEKDAFDKNLLNRQNLSKEQWDALFRGEYVA